MQRDKLDLYLCTKYADVDKNWITIDKNRLQNIDKNQVTILKYAELDENQIKKSRRMILTTFDPCVFMRKMCRFR